MEDNLTLKKESKEIDLKEMISILLDRAWIILLCGMIAGICSGWYSWNQYVPLYVSKAKIYVINRQTTESVTLADLQIGTQLTKDYIILIKSRPVLEQVITKLNLNCSYEEMYDMVTASTQIDTRIIQIEVRYREPGIAKKIVNTVAEMSISQMDEVMEIDKVNIVEWGNEAARPLPHDLKKNVMLGGVIGVSVPMILFLFLYVWNDSVRTIDDVEHYLEWDVLGILEKPIGHNKESQLEKEAYYNIMTHIKVCHKNDKILCFTSAVSGKSYSTIVQKLEEFWKCFEESIGFLDADYRETIEQKKEKNQEEEYPLGYFKYFLSAFDNLKEEKEYILIHTPPIVNVSDAILVSQFCDGIIIILDSNQVSFRLLQRVKRQLERSNTKVTGVILNNVEVKKRNFFTYYCKKIYSGIYEKTYYKEE